MDADLVIRSLLKVLENNPEAWLTDESALEFLRMELGLYLQPSSGSQCEYQNQCQCDATWFYGDSPYCTKHTLLLLNTELQLFLRCTEKPSDVDLENIELLGIIRRELEKGASNISSFWAVTKVIKELGLRSLTPQNQDIAAWYLWKMNIFSIVSRRAFYFE